MTPMDLFMWGIYALIIMTVLVVIEFLTGMFTNADTDVVVGGGVITVMIGMLVWILMWIGAVVLWIISL